MLRLQCFNCRPEKEPRARRAKRGEAGGKISLEVRKKADREHAVKNTNTSNAAKRYTRRKQKPPRHAV